MGENEKYPLSDSFKTSWRPSGSSWCVGEQRKLSMYILDVPITSVASECSHQEILVFTCCSSGGILLSIFPCKVGVFVTVFRLSIMSNFERKITHNCL